MTRIAAWDIEIYREIPAGARSWTDLLPLGITCASVCYTHPEDTGVGPIHRTWWGGQASGRMGDRMSSDEVAGMLDELGAMVEEGYTIFTWNGLSFDWQVLDGELFDPSLKRKVRELAMGHCDMMFQFFCDKGYMLGLDAVAKGLRLPGKMEGMDGSLAPVLWSADTDQLVQRRLSRFANMDQEQRRRVVIEYLEQDALTTYQIADLAGKLHLWSWTSKSGKPQQYRFRRWLAASDALKTPEPDTSWMRNPVSRDHFYSWTKV